MDWNFATFFGWILISCSCMTDWLLDGFIGSCHCKNIVVWSDILSSKLSFLGFFITTFSMPTLTHIHPNIPQQLVSGQRPQSPLQIFPSLSHNRHGNNHNQALITNPNTPESCLHGLGRVCRATFEDCPSQLIILCPSQQKDDASQIKNFPKNT